MDQVKAILAQKTAILDGYARMIKPLDDAAKKANVNPGLPLAGILFVVAVLTLLLQGFAICVTAYTVLYPGILSIRAIESEQKSDDKVWLTYWVMFAFLHVAETFFGFVFYFIPYWTFIRIGLFVYLLQFNGAETLYKSVVMDVIRKNQTLIKDLIARS